MIGVDKEFFERLLKKGKVVDSLTNHETLKFLPEMVCGEITHVVLSESYSMVVKSPGEYDDKSFHPMAVIWINPRGDVDILLHARHHHDEPNCWFFPSEKEALDFVKRHAEKIIEDYSANPKSCGKYLFRHAVNSLLKNGLEAPKWCDDELSRLRKKDIEDRIEASRSHINELEEQLKELSA